MTEYTAEFAETVLREINELYQKTKTAYKTANYDRDYELSQIWEDGNSNMNRMQRYINSELDAVGRVRETQKTFMFSINPSNPIKERMVDWYLSYFKQRGWDLFNAEGTIQESEVSDPAILVERSGRIFSPDFLRCVTLYLELVKYTDLPKKATIVELGGGCGYLARTFKLFQPGNTHVDIDLPETLYFAYIFLRLSFPEAKVSYVTDQSGIKGDIRDYDFVLVPTMFADCILGYDFDLFCNTASLGEMTVAVQRQWMNTIQNKLKVKYFLGLNRYLNVIDPFDDFGSRRLNENEASVLFDYKWRILQWAVEPEFARCPFEETIVTRNLEIIAERLPSTDEHADRISSQKLVEDVMDEDWIRYISRYTFGTMRMNVLVNNMEKEGTLFKLWDSIRLFPNKTNISLMLIYLNTITKTNYPFEEWFYYKKLLSGVSANIVSAKTTPDISLLDVKYEPVWQQAQELADKLYAPPVKNPLPPPPAEPDKSKKKSIFPWKR